MDNRGYVKIYRKVFENPLWQNANDWRLAMTLILKANWEPATFQSRSGDIVKVGRGELVTSLISLRRDSGLSTDEIRTSLCHLEKAQFLTNQSTNHFRKIKIINYSKYQDVGISGPKQKPKDLPRTSQALPNDISIPQASKQGRSGASRAAPPSALPNGQQDTIKNRVDLGREDFPPSEHPAFSGTSYRDQDQWKETWKSNCREEEAYRKSAEAIARIKAREEK